MKGPLIMSTQMFHSADDGSRLHDHDGLNEVLQSMTSKKRKRGSLDHNGDEPGSKRGSLSTMNGKNDHMNGTSAESFSDANNEFADLHQHLQNANNASNNASTTAAAALVAAQLDNSVLSFVSTGSGTDGDRQLDASFDLGGADGGQNHNQQSSPYSLAPFTSIGGTAAQVQAAREASNGHGLGGMKPAVGTDEWHKVRRDNHKEVERRRRETINEGINELAKIVPGCEKNKGSILQRAVHHILELKRQHEEFADKKMLEKVVMEQALTEVTNKNEVFKEGMEKAWAENRALKAKLRAHRIDFEEGDEGSAEGESE